MAQHQHLKSVVPVGLLKMHIPEIHPITPELAKVKLNHKFIMNSFPKSHALKSDDEMFLIS